VTYAFLVEREGRWSSLAPTLDAAADLAGGPLHADRLSPGRFVNLDRTVTATAVSVDLLFPALTLVGAA